MQPLRSCPTLSVVHIVCRSTVNIMAFRVAFVSGGVGGVGRATANKLASRGISIVLADMNEQ
jgi:NADP-dependent 3-hydroxy acid dehydrogenase YdfG